MNIEFHWINLMARLEVGSFMEIDNQHNLEIADGEVE